MGKTIKQIADELGISKQAITKRIENLGCRSELVMVGGQFQINEETEEKIKGYSSTDNQNFGGNSDMVGCRKLPPTAKLVDTITEQIAAKDAIILQQQEQISSFQQQLEEKERELAELRITAALYEQLQKEVEELKADKADLQQHRDNLTNALTLSKSDLARLENIITQMAALPLGTRIFGWAGAVQRLTDNATEIAVDQEKPDVIETECTDVGE